MAVSLHNQSVGDGARLVRTKTKQVAIFASALLAWAGLVAFQVGATFDAGGSAVLGLIFVAMALGFFISVIVGIVTRRWRFTLYFGIALLVVFSSLVAANFISDRQRVASIETAQPIIVAAERFRMATGTYPRSFDDLVPSYLSSEPCTRMGLCGTRFMLSSAPDRFYISFSLPVWMVCSYDSESKRWAIHD